jgi:uncharacterized membrane protein
MSVVSDRTPDPSAPQPAAPPGGAARRLKRELWRRWNNADVFVAPARSEWPQALRRVRTVGLVVLAVQLVMLALWSVLEVNRDALSWDFSLYYQPAYLIAHGHFDPYSSTFGFPFWQNDGEFIFWPLALFVRIYSHPVTLKLVQDIAIVAAETIAFLWICEIAATRAVRDREVRYPVALAALGVLMLVADPWLTWALSFDVHAEPFVVPFLIAAAYDMFRGRRRRAWIWIAVTIAGGAVPASYAGALGVSVMLSGRRWWRQGAAIAVVAFFWETALHALNASHGAGINGLYWQLLQSHNGSLPHNASITTLVKALIHHPLRALSTVWSNKTDLWATVAPVGLIGIFWPPALIVVVLILTEGALTQGFVFSFPGFQNAALVPLVAVGTIALLAAMAPRMRRWSRWLFPAVVALIAANSIVWGAIWLPQTETKWLLVPSHSASVLSALGSKIGPDAEVIAQQGVVGGFSGRASVYALVTANSTIPVTDDKVWVVFAPEVGIETAPVAGIYADIHELDANHAWHMVLARDGVWAFEWTAPRGTRTVTIGQAGQVYSSRVGSAAWKAALAIGGVFRSASVTPAWTVTGVGGRAVRRGPPTDWYAASNGQTGYVIDQAYWLEPRGTYLASVSLDASASTNVEVWDESSSTLLARRTLRDTHGRRTVRLSVDLHHLTAKKLFGGWGLWSAVPHPPLDGDNLEIRVWTAGAAGRVKVYSASIQ